ncbi:MAG: hypothetical protein R2932_24775 [Caldilineaceae bacterium]
MIAPLPSAKEPLEALWVTLIASHFLDMWVSGERKTPKGCAQKLSDGWGWLLARQSACHE